jgi:galactokinase
VIDPGELAGGFRARFGREARVYRAPGRVNLIGEHTDYNDGFVMPIALDRCTWVAAASRADRTIVVHSREYDETVTIDLDVPTAGPTGTWSDYVRGIAAVLDERGPAASAPEALRRASPELGEFADERRRDRPALHERDVGRPFQGRQDDVRRDDDVGRVNGADLLIASDVPIGAGLSSSAALEVACGYALADLSGGTLDLDRLARAAQRAEHEFAGMRCGIMDQMIACHGREGAALLLDTRTLARRYVPVAPAVRVVVCNTMVRHELASSGYNARRTDCEAGVAVLARTAPSIRALRDATLEQLDAARRRMPDRIHRRCRHVITENARVETAADALAAGDFHRFGVLMDASHVSLRDDFEVSCPELDAMTEILRTLDGVYGARMTGGGFGGCAVALVDAAGAASVQREAARRYQAATGLEPDVWVTTAGSGVGTWSLDSAPAA